MNKPMRALALVCTVAALTACDDDSNDPIGPSTDAYATVEGRVEQSSSSAFLSYASAAATTAGIEAQTVSVGRVQSDGSFSAMAQAEVMADGSFRIDSVPAGHSDLSVVAYADGSATGRVLVHERTEADAVIRTAPITEETTLEARMYAELHAMGHVDAVTDEELALFLRMDDAAAEAVLSSEAELQTAAIAFAEAQAALEQAFVSAGTELDASARADAMAKAAVDYSWATYAGAEIETAHDAFVEAALNAYAQAGATVESSVMATAAAASVFDARVGGTARGEIIREAMKMNLTARERLASSLSASVYADLAADIQAELTAAHAELNSLSSASEVEARLEDVHVTAESLTVDGMAAILVPGATLLLENEVRSEARAAFQTATLSTRFESATTAETAAQALVDYRAEVRTAVEAMVNAAGDTTADVDALTSLFIAASGSAHVH